MKKKAQKFLAHWAAPTGMGLYEISLQNLIDFGELVEQATLERAAQIAESEPKVWDIDAPSPQQRIALKIRAIKDSND